MMDILWHIVIAMAFGWNFTKLLSALYYYKRLQRIDYFSLFYSLVVVVLIGIVITMEIFNAI